MENITKHNLEYQNANFFCIHILFHDKNGILIILKGLATIIDMIYIVNEIFQISRKVHLPLSLWYFRYLERSGCRIFYCQYNISNILKGPATIVKMRWTFLLTSFSTRWVRICIKFNVYKEYKVQIFYLSRSCVKKLQNFLWVSRMEWNWSD